MPTITAKVSDELLAYIDQVSGGNRSEYLRRCLEAGPGDLESGLKIVTNQLSDVNRKLDYLFGHCCKVSDEAAFCLIQRPYISKT
uniref:hypothetical protein n=1 Tax=Escherichia coli TaxID=562 RepID=UPI000A7AA38D